MAGANDPTFAKVGRQPNLFTGTVNQADTSPRDLFQLPAGSIITDGRIIGYFSGPSNATSPTISVGVSPTSGGLGTEYLNGWSLAGANGSNFQAAVPWTRFGAQNSNTWTQGSANNWAVGSNNFWVSGKVGGTPGIGSGPWEIVFEVLTV